MKRLFLFVILPLVLWADATLKNGNFEGGMSEWNPTGGTCALDQDFCVEGKQSIRLECDRGSVLQTIEIKEGVTYEISGYIRGEGIPDGDNRGARIILEGNKRWRRITSQQDNSNETGTFDWRYATGTFTAKDLDSTTIKISPTVIGGGKAWFDNIQVHVLNDENSEDLSTRKFFRKNYGSSVAECLLYPGQCAEQGSKGIRGFFVPGDPIDLHMVLKGAGYCSISLSVKDWHGNVLWRDELQDVSMPYSNTFVLDGNFPKGYYYMEAEVKDESGKRAYFCQCGFVVQEMPLAKRDTFYSFGYGVDSSFAEGYKRIGTGNISLKLYWQTFYKRTPQFLLDYNLNAYKAFLENDDFELDVHVHTAPTREMRQDDEALAEGYSCLTDEMQRFLHDLVTEFAKATKGRIATWSSGQEIASSATMKTKYCGTWSEAMYHQMVLGRIVSRAVRKVEPGMRFLVGANNQMSSIEPYERIVLEDLKDDFDGYLIDCYTGNWNLMLGNVPQPEAKTLEFLEKSSELASSLGKSPVIRNNETGYCVSYGSPLDSGMTVQQAEYTARSIILNRVGGALSYELHRPNNVHEKGQNDVNAMSMNTIWRTIKDEQGEAAGIPLPGAAMYATLARELAFVKCTNRYVYGSFHAYVFQREDGKRVAAIWNKDRSVDVEFDVSETAKLVTMMGEESEFSGSGTITLSTSPIYLVTNEDAEKLSGEIQNALRNAVPAYRVSALREDEENLAVYLNNFGDETVSGEIVVEGREPLSVSLLPHLIKKVMIPYAAKGAFVQDGRVMEFVDEAPAVVRVPRVLSKPALDGKEIWLMGMPSFKLEYPLDIFPRSALQPEKAYFKTSYSPDKHNISAECNLAYNDEFLFLAAKVDDPIHCQHFDPANLWRGDSLQFSFAVDAAPPMSVCFDEREPNRVGKLNYVIALHDDGQVKIALLQGTKPSAEVLGNVTREGDNTFYEVAIPWKAIGMTPQSGAVLRMGFVIFDSISSTDKQAPYWLSFAQGVAGGQDSAKFAPLILE